jgi:hypothetical protein
LTSLTYFTVTADWVPASSVGSLSGIVTFQMLVTEGDGLVAPTLTTPGIVVPITTQGRITNGVLYGLDGNPGVSLLANTSVLNLSSTLYYSVSFADVVYTYPTSSAATQTINLSPFTFAALTSAATVDLSDVAPAAGALAAQILSITSAEIADATTLGRQLLTAPNAAAARLDLGAAAYLGPVASETTMLALTGNIGDYCRRSDFSALYYLLAEPASVLGNWAKSGGGIWPFPMARNTIAAIGDSITANGEVVGYQPAIGHSHLQQLQLMTHQRIRFGGANFAVSGSTIGQALINQLPNVLAMNPLPGACAVASATNDLWVVAAPNPNFNNMVSTLKTIVATLVNAGIVPILWTVPPNTNTTSGIAPANYQANIHQWNSWVRRFAAINAYPLIDAHAALAAIDGTYTSGYGASDLIHPNGPGERVIAQQALADGLADIFPPNSLVHTARQTNDLSNLFNDGTTNLGLFTTDSNSDGVADGLTASGTATYSLVTPVASDKLYGKWQQMAVTAGNTAVLQSTISTGWATGNQLAFSARIQTQGIEASTANFFVAIVAGTPGGYTPPGGTSTTVLYNGMENWQADVEDGELYVEFPIISQITSIRLYMWVSSVPSGTAILRVGEATIRNLTAGGTLT